MARGIERRQIFVDDVDRQEFLKRLSELAGKDRCQIFAFCLMPNHFHLLTRTLNMGLSRFMRRLLTGYAGYFNRRHDRAGHLFQNRFKSFVVDDQSYLIELVRYVHLNPIRAKILTDLTTLEAWPYCGYSTLMGKVDRDWLAVDEILAHLSSRTASARTLLQQFMADGIDVDCRPELGGGGRKRSLGLTNTETDREISSDQRILGSTKFVDKVLAELERAPEKRSTMSLEQLIAEVSEKFGLTEAELCSGSRRRVIVRARASVIWLGTKELGLTASELAAKLCVKPTTIYMSLVASETYRLESVADEYL